MSKTFDRSWMGQIPFRAKSGSGKRFTNLFGSNTIETKVSKHKNLKCQNQLGKKPVRVQPYYYQLL